MDLVVATYTVSPERLKQVTMAGPYYQPGEGLMVRKGDSDLKDVNALSHNPDLKVCTGIGSTGGDLIKEYLASPSSQLVQFDVLSKCGDALQNKQVDAVTADTGILAGLVSSSRGTFEIVGKPYGPNDYAVGMKKGDVDFCNYVEDVLTRSYSDGSYQKAWGATLGQVEPAMPPLPTFIPCS